MKKVICPKCHGKGKTSCQHCHGKGVRSCPNCGGTGHACPVCCQFGTIGWRAGYVKDKYGDWVHCPNCHGDYNNAKYKCKVCGGEGKVSCKKTEICSMCDGTGEVNTVSKSNLRVFRAVNMAVGFSGLQYLYVGRWLLFLLQFATFAAFGAAMCFPEQILTFIARFGIEGDYVKTARIILGGALLINILLGMFVIKSDGQGGKLKDDYKRGWFWTFFLLFGFTGAHLAYAKERLLLGIHLLWITFPAVKMITYNGSDIGRVAVVLASSFGTTLFEFVLAKISNAIFDTHFLDEESFG